MWSAGPRVSVRWTRYRHGTGPAGHARRRLEKSVQTDQARPAEPGSSSPGRRAPDAAHLSSSALFSAARRSRVDRPVVGPRYRHDRTVTSADGLDDATDSRPRWGKRRGDRRRGRMDKSIYMFTYKDFISNAAVAKSQAPGAPSRQGAPGRLRPFRAARTPRGRHRMPDRSGGDPLSDRRHVPDVEEPDGDERPVRPTTIHPGRRAERRRRRAARTLHHIDSRPTPPPAGTSFCLVVITSAPYAPNVPHHDLDDEAEMCHLDIEYWPTATAVH